MRERTVLNRPALAAGASFLLVAAGLAAVGAMSSPATAAGGCADTNSGTVKIATSQRETFKQVKRSPSGVVTYTEPEVRRGPVDLGTVAITMTTCKRNGTWRILDSGQPVSVSQPARDLRLVLEGGRVTKVEPLAGPLGYQVVHRRTGDGKVELAALRCSEEPRKFSDNFKRTVNALLSVPMPLSYATSVGVEAAKKVLPDAPEDRYWCSRIGPYAEIPLAFTRDGRPYLRWGTLPNRWVQRTATTTSQDACRSSTYCADITDEIVRMQAGV